MNEVPPIVKNECSQLGRMHRRVQDKNKMGLMSKCGRMAVQQNIKKRCKRLSRVLRAVLARLRPAAPPLCAQQLKDSI